MKIDTDKVIIIAKPDNIGWDKITNLLNLSFAERVEQGLNYSAATITVSEAMKKYKKSICLVAVYEDELVGTLIFRIRRKDKKSKWYHDNLYISTQQMAVSPIFKNKGIARKLKKT